MKYSRLLSIGLRNPFKRGFNLRWSLLILIKKILLWALTKKIWSIMIYKRAFNKALPIFTVPTYFSIRHSYQKTWKTTVSCFQPFHFPHTNIPANHVKRALHLHNSNSLKSKAAPVNYLCWITFDLTALARAFHFWQTPIQMRASGASYISRAGLQNYNEGAPIPHPFIHFSN